ncbi:Undecaprenyl-phosphate galactose phosphotransferase, WbaP/exopolysaccharide biosynthesis polyprenyl glycosylphosphotransferase [Micromonospora mirobrigensis]|uniref:Undecaprenyl-phosphate galactose phosphotransferase, WbaP/exopolysaccharide biosynthesis polyprenyl glycosylphosphotransferase n=1 Tax=Micromonospora mirobrigensis TaxID=262898 RepID=A0A1C4XKV4_9ACTN|nr:Undecaprenyl-phosphate galactose phosphotransferase, WbaP/exopolysaccharide biosynthesis polyprenyl glycosylphosphotransferase [Micromonospora mirobrigensis]
MLRSHPSRPGTDPGRGGLAKGEGRLSTATLLTPSGTSPRSAYEPAGSAARAAQRTYLRNLAVLDTAVLSVAVLAGYLLRFGETAPSGAEVPYELVAPGLVLAWLVSLRAMRCYDDRVLGYGAEEYRRVSAASLRLAGGVAIAGYIAEVGVSRGFLAYTFAIGTVGLEVARFGARKWLHRARSRGAGWSRKVLVVGDTAHVLELVHTLRREPYAGYQVVGACIPDALLAPVPQRLDDVPVVGSFRGIPEAATAIGADTVAVTASGELTAARLRRLGWQLEGTGVDLVVAPALTDVAGPRIHTRPVAGLPLIHVEAPEFRGARKLVKGLVDRAAAALALLLLTPLIAVICLAIKLDSRGPVLFRQVRVGQGGREFGVFKFRTMVVNADALLAELAARNETDGLMFKMRDDPRVTRVGRLLRKWSLDELPQLVNVLLGQMSLVGPRPPLPSEVARYDGDVARRLLVKPGMTGLWQVSGRSDLSWEDGIRLDLYYVENWSLAADLTILWKTVGAVLQGRGAY